MPPVIIGTSALLLASLTLVDTGRRLARRVEPDDPWLRALITVVIATSLVLVLLEVLGVAGLLNDWSPVPAALLPWAVAISLDRLMPSAAPVHTPRSREPIHIRHPSTWGLPLYLLVAAALVLVTIIAATLNGVWRPAAEFDVLARHLPIAVTWVQAGNLRGIPQLGGSGLEAAYPANSELLALWLLLPLHQDFLVQLASLPALLMMVFGVGIAARRLGASPPMSLLAALMVPSLPLVLASHIGTNMTDLLGAGSIAAAAALLASATGERRAWLLALAGLGAGIAAGSRYSAALATLPLLLVAAAPAVAAHSLRRVTSDLIVFLLSLALTGGYFYARNALILGDPLYPQSLPWYHVHGLRVAALDVKSSFVSLGWNPTLWRDALYLNTILGGVVSVVLTLSAVFPALAAAVRRERRLLAWAWALWPALEVALYLALPLSAVVYLNLRYLMPAWVASATMIAVLASRMRPGLQRMVGAGVLLVAAGSGLVQSPHRPPLLLLAIAAVLLLAAYMVLAVRPGRRLVLISAAAVVVGAVVASPAVASHYQRGRTSLPFGSIADRLTPEDRSVAVVGFCELYPLYGRDFNRRVEYPTGTGNLLDPVPTSYGSWFDALKRQGATTVVVGNDTCFRTSDLVPQAKWIRDNPDVFRLTYADRFTSIYHVTDVATSSSLR